MSYTKGQMWVLMEGIVVQLSRLETVLQRVAAIVPGGDRTPLPFDGCPVLPQGCSGSSPSGDRPLRAGRLDQEGVGQTSAEAQGPLTGVEGVQLYHGVPGLS